MEGLYPRILDRREDDGQQQSMEQCESCGRFFTDAGLLIDHFDEHLNGPVVPHNSKALMDQMARLSASIERQVQSAVSMAGVVVPTPRHVLAPPLRAPVPAGAPASSAILSNPYFPVPSSASSTDTAMTTTTAVSVPTPSFSPTYVSPGPAADASGLLARILANDKLVAAAAAAVMAAKQQQQERDQQLQQQQQAHQQQLLQMQLLQQQQQQQQLRGNPQAVMATAARGWPRGARGRDGQRRRWQCETCGKSLSSKCSLQVHYRTHTGERPHVCELCEATFADPSSRRRHMKLRHGRARGAAAGAGAANEQVAASKNSRSDSHSDDASSAREGSGEDSEGAVENADEEEGEETSDAGKGQE